MQLVRNASMQCFEFRCCLGSSGCPDPYSERSRRRIYSAFRTKAVWAVGFLACLCFILPVGAAAPDLRRVNLALDCDVQLEITPNYLLTSDSADAAQLVDGILATQTPMWMDQSAVGWVQVNPMVLTMDLGGVKPIQGVAFHMAAGLAGVAWPAGIRLYVSETGVKYTQVGDLMKLLDRELPEEGYAAVWLRTERLETWGRYVKVVVEPGAMEKGGYLIMDEIEIYQGEPDWLKCPLVASNAPEHWLADWREMEWAENATAVSANERPVQVRVFDNETEDVSDAVLQQAQVDERGATFTLLGEAGKARAMSWRAKLPTSVSTENCPFAIMTFQAEGISRKMNPRPMVVLRGVSDTRSANDVVLLEANMALNDGRSHTVVCRMPDGFTAEQLVVSVFTESDAPRLALEKLEFASSVPDVFCNEIGTGDQAALSFSFADLGALMNGTLHSWVDETLTKFTHVFDGARQLESGPLTVSGIPFQIAAGEEQLARMPESIPPSNKVPFLRSEVSESALYPESRHDQLAVNVDVRASEVFLFLALSVETTELTGGRRVPLRLVDIECISVELTYDEGSNVTAFPYSLADRGCYMPARELGAYAVAADPTRQLKKVTLHNRRFGPNFALAGLTFNTSAELLVPQLAEVNKLEETQVNPEPAARPLTVTHEGTLLTFANRWYEYTFDLAKGFSINGVVNHWNDAAQIKLAPESGLRIRRGNDIYTGGCFTAEVLRVTGTDAEIKLLSRIETLPLEVTVTITASDSPELAFNTKVLNSGSTRLNFELCLPALSKLEIGDLNQTRMFFPQVRNVDTAEYISLHAPYGVEFTVQFMDVYNSRTGTGLMLRTDNQRLRMIDFALSKNQTGVSGGACFTEKYNSIASGATEEYPTVSLVSHNGDWREAHRLYRSWVHTWYTPYRSQDKDSFINAWDFMVYRVADKLSWSENHTPGLITSDRTEILMDENIKYDLARLGHVPDFIHFYGWAFNDTYLRGSVSSEYVYSRIGGLELFRSGVSRAQNYWQRPLSIYTYPEVFSISILDEIVEDRDLFYELLASGGVDVEDDTDVLRASSKNDLVFPLKGTEIWDDFVIDDLVKMQRDMGCKMVYLDVFPYFAATRCIPGMNPRSSEMRFLEKLREALPKDVVLWHEYGATDILSQYSDGGGTYYFIGTGDLFARPYNWSDRADSIFSEMPLNIFRYTIPKYKNILWDTYYEGMLRPSSLDAGFVNGDVSPINTRRLTESRMRVKLDNSHKIKHAYNECFLSENPDPRVYTEVEGISANLFPGENRKLWTIYNGRPATFSGVILAVPHRQGAKYRDAWNDKEIFPVIENGMAKISVRINPQQPGCVVQDWSEGFGCHD